MELTYTFQFCTTFVVHCYQRIFDGEALVVLSYILPKQLVEKIEIHIAIGK